MFSNIRLYNIAKFFLFLEFFTRVIADAKLHLLIKLKIFLSSSYSISNQKKISISLFLGLLKLSIDFFI